MTREKFVLQDSKNADGSLAELFENEKPSKFATRKIVIIVGVTALLVLALILGLLFGLRVIDTGDNSGSTSGQTCKHCTTTTTTTTATTTVQPKCSYQPVLLISLDGFRADYIKRNVTPEIDKLIKKGVHTPYMRPVYPTYTFPNHYTIVTGLYPESHGIIANTMFDMKMNMSFSIGAPQSKDTRWWGGEPMWVTAKLQGKKTATYFWVGSDFIIQGQRPDYYKAFNYGTPYTERVDTILQWMSLPQSERPDFLTLYFQEPDSSGHNFGPNSEKVNPALEKVDNMIGRLVDGLKERNLEDCVNIIVLADHGMTPRSCDRAVALNDVLFDDEMKKITTYTSMFGRISNKYVKSGKKYTILDKPEVSDASILGRLRCISPHLRSYMKQDIPKRHHYIYNDRIENIIMDVDNEWIISRTRNPTSGCSGGTHGEDNIYASEGALFVASGPAFKENVEVEPFESIEVYNLIADNAKFTRGGNPTFTVCLITDAAFYILDVKPAPNNGTKGALYHLLKSPPSAEPEPLTSYTECSKPAGEISQSVEQTCQCTLQDVGSGTFNDLPALSELLDNEDCKMAYGVQKSGFSADAGLPRWTSVYLNSKQTTISTKNPGCVVEDPGLSDENKKLYTTYNNTDMKITAASLVPFKFKTGACGTVTLTSAMAPMYTGFKDEIWTYAMNLVESYLSQHGELQVTAGPIWDYNYDGLYDNTTMNNTIYVDAGERVILPTHYFLTIQKCGMQGSTFPCAEKVDLLSLILPHKPNIVTCESPDHYCFENVARLRDIELLTGLRFFSELPVIQAAPLRTFLPTALWDSPILKPAEQEGSWINNSCHTQQCPTDYKPVLLISLDGFRGEYLKTFPQLTPTIKRLSECGVHTPFIRSAYPTKTFPNHNTIATGLYPESHGIIDNSMFDASLDQKFSLSSSNKQDPRWWLGEPIWQTVMKSGKKAASFFWPGTDVKEMYPNYFKRYLKGKVPFRDRVDMILYWLTRPAGARPDFLTLYMDEPDHQMHYNGPNSVEVQDALRDVDSHIQHLMDGLYKKNLHNCVNIILLADHGSSTKNCYQMVSMKRYLTSSDIRNVYIYQGPFGRISNKYVYGRVTNKVLSTPKVTKETLLSKLQCKNSHLRVYDKPELPVRHHYVDSSRIDDIILDIDEEWLISRDGRITGYCTGGDHGYDNLYRSMGALFTAHGPAFKRQYGVDTFENIEIYNLMTTILGVAPAPNNGTTGTLDNLLRDPPKMEDNREKPTYTNCSAAGIDTYESVRDTTCSCTSSTSLQATEVPRVNIPTGAMTSLCSIQRSGVTTVFSGQLNMPLWTAVTLLQSQATNMVYPSSNTLCVVPDPLLDTDSRDVYTRYTSTQKGIIAGSFVPGLNDSCRDARSSSVVAPMYSEFHSGIWKTLWDLIATYSLTYGDLGVTVGPVFDFNGDGKYNDDINGSSARFVDANNTVPLPTHFFVVVTRCSSQTSRPCTGQLEVMSFILPHLKSSPNCLDNEKYLQENVARVRDIELITGLSFFTELPMSQMLKLVTFLPMTLWPAQGWFEGAGKFDFESIPCPEEPGNTCTSGYKPLLLISFDGFRPDYLKRGVTPVLNRMIECGSSSLSMRPSYPSQTFPNEYTIVTGLYPESHGIVDNTMYDHKIGKKFTSGGGNKFDPRWWGGEPLWVTAQKQGKKAASFFWIGSEMNISGQYPDEYKKYEKSYPFTDRVETVVEWMSRPADTRPDFISLYFHEPDDVGKDNGPVSDEVDAAVKVLDETIGYLMQLLQKKNLHNCVNIVITGDHGMAPLKCDRVITYSDFFSYDDLRTFYIYLGTFSHVSNTYKYKSSSTVTPVDSPKFSLTQIADRLRCNNTNVKVRFKNDMPRRLHYANNDRIEGVYLDLTTNWTSLRTPGTKYCTGGSDGYDPSYKTMNSLFVSYGPAFNINTTLGSFQNIELYNMMTDVLQIQPAPNNGTHGSLHPALRSPPVISRDQGVLYDNTSTVDNAQSVQNMSSNCGCPLSISQSESLLQNMNTQDRGEHLPFGVPTVYNTSAYLLNQPSFITGYSSAVEQPLWISYTLNSATIPVAAQNASSCYLRDLRVAPVSADQSCDIPQLRASSSYRSLIPPELQEADDTYKLSTSMVPMLDKFSSGIWGELSKLLKQWTEKFGEINVISGPIYDENHNGVLDTNDTINGSLTFPSDFFTIVSRCKTGSVSLVDCDTPEVITFIIPHQDSYKFNCQNATSYLLDYEARVRDVELLTGLEFFTKLPVISAVQLRTSLIQTLWGDMSS